MYKVLWFDDEYQNLEITTEEAMENNIKLIGVSNAKDGLEKLENNKYDAVLLDGLFFTDNTKTADNVSDDAFGKVVKALTTNYNLPWFIFSGQKAFVKDKNSLVNLFAEDAFGSKTVYSKHSEQDSEQLWADIKKEVDKNPERIIRNKHKDIFKIFELGYLLNDTEDNVLELLKADLPKNNSELKAMLVNIRSIQESCFIKLESIRLIPTNLKFRKKIKHLSGNISKDSNWKPVSEVYQTDEIMYLHNWIHFTCGTYIHYLEKEHYQSYKISNYAVESLRQGILEILLWFKQTYKENI